ncbi:hypothetical protein DFA_01977 [Cavenderia fasciculata]|uniref:THUMP domain-containing protein n=1 Tax=Cavenderia fasciculata TaxID=261658 RepID=F4PR30_CACFS|nr:uncharacterized protein DFA_01977 [Cavenderia fasciculata]EGG22087.1 hypothetical protein DFA_01977 [Cavenderia fasciculata]|eukprot:XP_004359938.1 hypothetical protein DFA_01977 [Cavenderia fasciculata]
MSDHKRKIGNDDNASKDVDQFKKQKGDNNNTAVGGTSQLHFKYGTSGFLITFDKGRENQASKDMFTLLNNYLQDNHYSNLMSSLTRNNDKVVATDEKSTTTTTTTTTSTTSSDNFMNSFEAELQQLQSSSSSANGKKKKNNNNKKQNLYDDPFERFKFHVEGLSFISIKDNLFTNINQDDENNKDKLIKLREMLNVYHVANTLFESMERDKSTKSKFISRIIPVQTTCSFTNLLDHIKPLVEAKFNSLEKSVKYNIEFRSRHNTSASELKKDYISVIAALIKLKHTVDLITPEMTIVIEVIKTFTTISIVDNFIKRKERRKERGKERRKERRAS